MRVKESTFNNYPGTTDIKELRQDVWLPLMVMEEADKKISEYM